MPRTVDPKSKEILYNPRYEELYAPVLGPENPHLTEQQKAPRNMLSGYVEKAHISEFNFENQRRTFHTYGYALDPSVNGETSEGHSFVGDLQTAYDTDGKTVFESPMPKKKRKQDKNDKPEDIEGFLGPWGKYENEQDVARPSAEQKAALDEILAKRNRRHKVPEDKPLEEKSILHSESREPHSIESQIFKLFFFYLFFSQRPNGLPGPFVPACTARCWCQSTFQLASGQMLPAEGSHSHMDGTHERHFSYSFDTKNSASAAISQHGLTR